MVSSCSAWRRFIASSKVVLISVLLAVFSLLLFVTVWLKASKRSLSGARRASKRSLSAVFIFSRLSSNIRAAILRTSSCRSRFFASACFWSSLRSCSPCFRSASSCCKVFSFTTAIRSSTFFRSVSSWLRRTANCSPAFFCSCVDLFFIQRSIMLAPMMMPRSR